VIALLAIAMTLAAPVESARVRINCPAHPIFFENGRRDIDAAGRDALATAYDWVLDQNRQDVRIVLRTATREPESIDPSGVSYARAEAVRDVLVADGIPADHILVAHDYSDGPDFAPEGWIGGWVELEFYVSPSEHARLFPPNSPPC
jgi:hypothetical protein